MRYEFTQEHGPLDDFASLMVRLALAAERGGLDQGAALSDDTKSAIKAIGRELHEKFGLEGMRTADSALFELSGSASARVDKLWSGIGDYVA